MKYIEIKTDMYDWHEEEPLSSMVALITTKEFKHFGLAKYEGNQWSPAGANIYSGDWEWVARGQIVWTPFKLVVQDEV